MSDILIVGYIVAIATNLLLWASFFYVRRRSTQRLNELEAWADSIVESLPPVQHLSPDSTGAQVPLSVMLRLTEHGVDITDLVYRVWFEMKDGHIVRGKWFIPVTKGQTRVVEFERTAED